MSSSATSNAHTLGAAPPRHFMPCVLAAFAFSGAAGLIYQSIWAQYLGLFLGHAAYAQSLVLGIFMGGMALGAWWMSVRAIRWHRLLRNYALVELAIGAAAALFDPEYAAATAFAYDHAFPALGGGAAAAAFKWAFAAVLILPQAMLLGATFPLLSNGVMRASRVGDGRIVSVLYFANSIGAAIGALLATFVLLPWIGLPGAMGFGALLNGAAALLVFGVARGEQAPPSLVRPPAADSRRDSLMLLLAAAFVTGATSFVYEIGWVRMLVLVFGSTVHAFELMLAAFIGGLAFGGLWIRKRIDSLAQPIRAGGYVQVAMGAAALASLLFYDHLFDWVAWFMDVLPHSDAGYDVFNLVTATAALLIMAPAAFFAGMTLPLFTVALIRDSGSEASVGRIYAANTVGAIFGVFLAVHVLVPGVGLKLSMIAAATADMVLGLILLRLTQAGYRIKGYAVAVGASVCAVGLALFVAKFDVLAMAHGVYRVGSARFTDQQAKVLYYRDGKTASIAALVHSSGEAIISTNGKPDASIQLAPGKPASADEITMVMLAAVPLATHPDLQTAAVIGFGSGLSTHSLLAGKHLQHVDTIEIERAMYDGARIFGEHVARAYTDPRSTIRFDDAKAFFAANQSRYDLILSEPSNPWVSGVANLFSREFYGFVPRHLKPGGLLVQWVQQYEITDELIATIVRALAPSFADYRVYLTDNADMLIVARADGPLAPFDFDALRRSGMGPELDRVGLGTLADFTVRQIGTRHSLQPLFDAESERSNSDFHPILSLEAPRSRFAHQHSVDLLDMAMADLPLREALAGIAPPDAKQIDVSEYYSATGRAHEAADIAEFLRADPAPEPGTDPAMQWAARLRSQVAACRSAQVTQDIDVLVASAGRTIPFLDAQALEGVWIKPRWIDCSAQPGAVADMLHLLDMLAQRDFAQVEALASALLRDQRAVLSPYAQDWLLRAAMLGAAASGHYAQVRAIDQSVGKDVATAAETVVQRSYLLAFADAQLHR